MINQIIERIINNKKNHLVVALDFVHVKSPCLKMKNGRSCCISGSQDNTRLLLTSMSVHISTSNIAFSWDFVPGQQLTAVIFITFQNLTCNQATLKPIKVRNSQLCTVFRFSLFLSLICVTSSSLPCSALSKMPRAEPGV